MKAHYLGHVVFYVKDLEKSLSFYRDMLGFEQVGEFSRPFTAIALSAGRIHHDVLLIQVGDAPGPPKGHRIGLYHIGIKVGDSLDDLRAVRDEFIEAGIHISGLSDHTVSQSIYLEDPDGNEVELYVDDPNVDWKNDHSLVMSQIKQLNL